MLFDEEEKTDFDEIASSGESKEIARAEKKAAKKAQKDAKKRARLLKEAERLGFTPEMLGEDFGKEMSLDEILSDKKDKNKEDKPEDKKAEDKSSEKQSSDDKKSDETSSEVKDSDKTSDEKKEGSESEDKKSEEASEGEKESGDKKSEDEKTDGSEESSESEKGKKSKKKGVKERDPQYNVVKELLSTIIYMGVVILLVFVLFTYVGQKVVVDGGSMNPTLENADTLWVDKLRYRFTEPKRFDVIVFPYRKGSDILFIKRIIGLPGETVQIDNGKIYINGNLLEENYGMADIEDPGIASSKVILAHDEYFVLGDNRNNSNDSRKSDVGNIKKENIMGKAVFRITPFSKFGSFDKKEE